MSTLISKTCLWLSDKEKGGEPGEKFKLSYNEGEVLKIRYTSSPTWEAINERGWQGKVNAYNVSEG